MTRSLNAGWELHLNTWSRRVLAILLVVSLSGAIVYRTWWHFRAAWITRVFSPDPAIYEQAIGYDPANADYHFLLAQIYNSSTKDLNLERAGQEFKEAVRLNPLRSAHWQELARWYENEKQIDAARDAVRHAIDTDPNYAKTHWFAANLLLRIGDIKDADFELRRAADLDTDGYLVQVLDLVWRYYEDPEKIIPVHVPNTKAANLAALNYFVSRNSDQGAAMSWTRLKAFDTAVTERFAYVDYLVERGQVGQALEVFSFPNPPAAFYNGGFETEPLLGGFDWRIESSETAEARRDATVSKDGVASLRVIFAGKENVNYYAIRHLLAVRKGGRYNLTFWMKTENISTNEGMFVEVDGQSSEKQTGTNYWKQFRIPFTATSDLVTVRLRRQPTNKFDNLLQGKVWVDAFDLTAIQ